MMPVKSNARVWRWNAYDPKVTLAVETARHVQADSSGVIIGVTREAISAGGDTPKAFLTE
jgi:hypothetical protein